MWLVTWIVLPVKMCTWMYVCGLREKNVGRIMSALESKSDWFALKLKLIIQLFWQNELGHHIPSCIFASNNRPTSLPNLSSTSYYNLNILSNPKISFSQCRKYTCAHIRCGLSVVRSVQSWRLGNCEGRFELFMWIFYFILYTRLVEASAAWVVEAVSSGC